MVVGSANAANITDGLDGLAAGCMVISGLALSIFCYVTGRPDWTGLPEPAARVREASEMAVVGGALMRRVHGLPLVQRVPGQGLHGGLGRRCRSERSARPGWRSSPSKSWLLPLIAFVFVAELGSSSWLQGVWYFKSHRRPPAVHHALRCTTDCSCTGGVFHAAPEVRWHEATIVVRFWIIAAACAMASLALLKMR